MNKIDSSNLASAPRGYSHMVATQRISEIRMCGDVDFLPTPMIERRTDFEALACFPDLQPFATSAGGDLWCWSTSLSGDQPRIFYVEYWGSSRPYAPSFETFLYRTCLEDASGRWLNDEDELREKIRTISAILRELDQPELASDMEETSNLAYHDTGTDEHKRLGIISWGMLSVEQCRERIATYLGTEYLDEYEGNV